MHSKGPWVWQGLHRDGAPVLYACGEPKHRLVKAASEPRLSEADARLIAAAPEMFDLLERLDEHVGETGPEAMKAFAEWYAIRDRIRSALPGG